VLLDDRPATTGGRALALLWAAHPGPAFGVTAMTAVLAAAVGLDLGTASLVVAAVLAGQLSIGWSNDLLDRDRDRGAGRTDKPLATGALPAGVVLTACRLAVVTTVVLSTLLGWRAGGAQLVMVAAGWAYNLRLKSTAWSWLPYAVGFGALATVPSLALREPQVAWWLPVVGGLLGVGAHLVNVLPDLDDDRAVGVAGLPHRLADRWGPHSLVVAAVLIFGLATGLLVASLPVGPAGVVAVAVVALLGALALTGRGRRPFRAAMGIALVNVVLLAVVL
jgi:4-hydroxybenzoate polyprenyltransferase